MAYLKPRTVMELHLGDKDSQFEIMSFEIGAFKSATTIPLLKQAVIGNGETLRITNHDGVLLVEMLEDDGETI